MAVLKPIRLFSLVTLFMLPPQYAFADNWLINFGYNQGGDRLSTIYGVDPDTSTIIREQHLNAGDSNSLSAGYLYNINHSKIDIQVSLGYQFTRISFVGHEAEFTQIPLEIIPFYTHNSHRIGAGLSYHISPTVDVNNEEQEFDADDAPGTVIQYDYHFSGWGSKGISAGIRYEWVEYEFDDDNYDGDHWGFQLNWLL